MKYNYVGYILNSNLFIEKSKSFKTKYTYKPWFKFKCEDSNLPVTRDIIPLNGSIVTDIDGNFLKIIKIKILVKYDKVSNNKFGRELRKHIIKQERKEKIKKLSNI